MSTDFFSLVPPPSKQKVLAFAQHDCALLCDTVDTVNLHGVDILVNAVWPQFTQAVFTKVAFIFAPGVADVFHKVRWWAFGATRTLLTIILFSSVTRLVC